MAQVSIQIAGRSYDLACRDGEEDHLHAIARMVDRKCADASQAMGGINEARQLLMAALLLADELNDMSAAASSDSPDAPAPSDAGLALAIERLAGRMESLADRLEDDAGNA